MEVVEMISGYFQIIYYQFLTFEEKAPWTDQVVGQLQLLKMDLRFLAAFSSCLESLDYTSDEESMERSRMITSLQGIWPKEYEELSLTKRLNETWPIWPMDVSIQDFHSVNFELEEKIQQSKQQVEGWCGNLMHSSMHSDYFTHSDVKSSLEDLRMNLKDFSSYRADKIVPLKKQSDILKTKIVFLEESLNIVEHCPDRDETFPFLHFVGDFANIATCLACLYWAIEDNEETATEMNIVLFDMLQKFIPFASDITPLYIGIRKSYDLESSDSFLVGEVVESLVDFFFEHLASTLKDDFLIIRDGLIFLFTFIADPPSKNAKDEDLIRSQIRALLHEDAYLLLPFDEMKEDFSNKRILLSDCIILIDTTIAKIRQLDCGFSDSGITLEAEQMKYIYFDSVQRELSWIEKHAQWADPVLGQLQLNRKELRFLRVFLLCFATWDDSDEEIRVRLSSIITSLQGIWRKKEEENGFLAHRLHAIRKGDITNWHPLASELEEKIRLSKLEIEAWSVNLFYGSFGCKPSASYKIMKFLDTILDNLNDLLSDKAGDIVLFKKQIQTLEEKIVFLMRFVKLTMNGIDSKELGEFNMFVQVFASDAAWLIFLYWAKDANDEIASERNSMFSHMLQKIKPTTPHVARLYFEAIKTMYLQRSDSLMFGQIVFSFVYLFLEDLVTILKDDFRILQDDIIFLLTFLNDPPNENAGELICSQIDVLFWEGVYCLLPFDDMEGDFSKKNVLLSNFMRTIASVNANIRHIYCKFPDSSLYNFPKVISPQFLDFLIQNLRNLKEGMISDREYAPFAKYMITKFEEELVSLSPLFNHIFNLQSELNETWLEVVNLVHLTEHVISSWISSWFISDHPIWYHMAYLSDVFDEIKDVKTKLDKIKENAIFTAIKENTISTLSEQASPSKINEIFVGFEDETEKIIDKLIWAHKSLDTVSIVGMGGLGKTTLAKKVYGSLSVKCNFHVFAFCSVSHDHNTRRLLLDILCDIKGGDDGICDMTEDDLAHQLWKCLSRQKYLIVLDDIWNESAWNKVKSSFPDDKNGSRVMFTTRSHDVADKCKINCGPHLLRFMSEVESWELLQKKVFSDGISPPYLYEIGKLIAKNCKGLPLAVAVIAGLLSEAKTSLRWWTEVAERVHSYLFDEGCMQILELSYKHLPENLKPCLLYIGAFPEDRLIRVKKVMLLWIAEGFVQPSNTKTLEDLAKEYFHDLVGRSLIIVNTRSSNGEIKTFRVHDLIHDLCQKKCRDANFFQLNHGTVSSSSSNISLNNYRVSTQKQSDVNIILGSSLSNAHSLLYFGAHSEDRVSGFPLSKVRLAQVLELDIMWRDYGIEQLSSLVLLRHIDATMVLTSIPSSISSLWNIVSLMLTTISGDIDKIHLPKNFWRLKSLRHVKIDRCMLKFSDDNEHEAYPKLDKVVSFSKPILSTGKDVQRLLQRLPVVRKLSCLLETSLDYDKEESVETFDFHRKLESLKLTLFSERGRYLINFPPTLKKLTLTDFQPMFTDISAIAELPCLQVLKLRWVSIPETRLEMEDVVFQNLKFFELIDMDLVEWNASTESLPSLEHLVINCPEPEELPPCFGELSSLKRIVVSGSPKVESSALQIQEEQMELGNKVDVSIHE